jgi:hypothetical protein
MVDTPHKQDPEKSEKKLSPAIDGYQSNHQGQSKDARATDPNKMTHRGTDATIHLANSRQVREQETMGQVRPMSS